MAVSCKKLPKELRKPKLATVVLEVGSKSGAPISARDKFRLRKAIRQFARDAVLQRRPDCLLVSALIALNYVVVLSSLLAVTFPKGDGMSTWTLFCRNCHFSFVHSIIEVKELADLVLPAKPDIAAEGAKFKCSSCGHVALYHRSELVYHA
jgi:hypothetical protein